MKTKLFLFISLIFLTYLNSCTSDINESNGVSTPISIIDEAAKFYAIQTLDNGTVLSQEPNWSNAEVSKTTDGSPLVTVQVYKGVNKTGLDSIQEIQFVQRKSGNIMLLRTLSSFNNDIAKVELSTLKGRLLEDGILYIPKNRYSTLNVYYRFGKNNKIISRVGVEDGGCATEESGTETPFYSVGGIPNPSVYNCHKYAWGPCDSSDSSYNPLYPNWRDYPPAPSSLGYFPTNSTNVSVGDRVIYWGYNAYGLYVPVHSAIVTSTYGGYPTELTSKWGQDGIYHHTPGCTPYGTDMNFLS